MRHLCPDSGKVDLGTLSLAVTVLNNKVREHSHSASQVHFSRDTGLTLDDSKLMKTMEERMSRTIPAQPFLRAGGAGCVSGQSYSPGTWFC